MKLTYRGVSYQSQATEVQSKQLDSVSRWAKYRLSSDLDSSEIILIRPIHFYTYRGVSYTKNFVYDTCTKILLSINQQ